MEKQKKNTFTHVRLVAAEKQRLEEAAKRRGVTVSALIREALKRFIAA